jgi:hypothetical protein
MADAGELGPAEAQMLLYPHEATGRSALSLTLLMLIARGVLRLEQTQQRAGIAGAGTLVRLGPTPPPAAPAYVVLIVNAVRIAQTDGGTLDAVLKELTKEFNSLPTLNISTSCRC